MGTCLSAQNAPADSAVSPVRRRPRAVLSAQSRSAALAPSRWRGRSCERVWYCSAKALEVYVYW
eukprot:6211767-Pleurochrysis_carterae.AAC.1